MLSQWRWRQQFAEDLFTGQAVTPGAALGVLAGQSVPGVARKDTVNDAGTLTGWRLLH